VRAVSTPALSLWECSANIETSLSQPAGFSDPFESGQSGKAMPAPMVVVNAPSVTSRNTQAAANAENAARAGLWPAVRAGPAEGAVGDVIGWVKVQSLRTPNALTIFSSGGLVVA
jgi:hypothetical protein